MLPRSEYELYVSDAALPRLTWILSAILSLFYWLFSRWTWVSRCLLKQRMMEVVVTTGAINREKLQSNHYHQPTNTQFFYRPDALSVVQPTVSKHWRENITSHRFAYPKLTGSLPTLSLATNSSWLPWGGLPCLSSAFWCQYPKQGYCLLHCTLSLAAQFIIIGPVHLCVCLFVGLLPR